MVDGIRERGRYYDIIIEALLDYDEWMKDDDYNSTTALNKIMKRMRERLEMSDPPQPVAVAPPMSPHTDAGALRAVNSLISPEHTRDDLIVMIQQRDLLVSDLKSVVEGLRQAASQGREGGEPSEVQSPEVARVAEAIRLRSCERGYPVHPNVAHHLAAAALEAMPASAQAPVMPAKLTGELACIIECCDPPEHQTDEAVERLIFDYQPMWDRLRSALAVPSAHQSAPSDSSSLPSGESDPSATTDFLGAGTGDNAAPYGNSPREIQKRAMKARTSAISSTSLKSGDQHS